MRTLRPLLWLFLFWLGAAPAFAYTIVLKDGSRVITREKYKIVNGKAILVLQNGTQATYDADAIDVPKTEQANQHGDYGSAVIFEDGKPVERPSAAPPPPPSLSDLIQKQGAGLRQPTSRRPETPPSATGTDTPAAPEGRRSFSVPELAAELQRYFRNRELEEVAVFGGSTPSSARIQVATPSEASVFRALVVAAKALQDIGERPGIGLSAIELEMATPSGEPAGSFRITPEMADELISKRTEVTTFYVKYVEI
ncbi:MAG: hypothetical protein KDD11_02120 [Acidobacteria bacterium]|nr:hypothetical protein [Acidobacteriota bacterium]